MATTTANTGGILPADSAFTYDEMVRSCRIIMHLVRAVTLGSHQVILHGAMPVVRSMTREHTHATYEAQLLLDGTADCCTETSRQSVAPGQVTLHAPGMPHSWHGHAGAFLRFTLHFSITPAPSIHLPEPWPHQPLAFATLRMLLEDIHTRAPGWSDRVVPHITLLLSRVLALTDWPDVTVPDFTTDSSQLHLLDHFLQDNLHRPLSRLDIANYLGISERTLTRQIHRLTGTTLLEWLENHRLARARMLLTETGSSVEAISRLVGYSSPSYFCRRFLRHVGMTPGQYREKAIHT